MKATVLFLSLLTACAAAVAQHHHEPAPGSSLPIIENIEPQPLMAQVRCSAASDVVKQKAR
jgi:hypothetical protein